MNHNNLLEKERTHFSYMSLLCVLYECNTFTILKQPSKRSNLFFVVFFSFCFVFARHPKNRRERVQEKDIHVSIKRNDNKQPTAT